MDDDNDPPKDDYEVGYGKPPKHTRFKKGQSGNPKGKEKGSRSLKKDLDAALNAKHTITLGGKKHKDSTQALAMLTLSLRAASGDLRSQTLLANLILQVFGSGERGGDQTRLSKQDQLLLERLLDRAEAGEDQSSEPDDDDAPPADGESDETPDQEKNDD